MSLHTYCTFYIDDFFFGVEVEKVQEIVRYQEMTRVPLAPEVVRGLINLRGQIVVAIDLRRQLGLADRPDENKPMNVIVRTADGPVSLLVDDIGDVVEVDSEQFDSPPDTLEGVARELIRGVYKFDGRLLLVLDIERATAVSAAA